MDLLTNLRDVYLTVHVLHVWRNKNLCETTLCDHRLTRIIRINKTRAEKCTITVLTYLPEPAEWLTLFAPSTVSSLPLPEEREEGERGAA